MTSFGLLMSFGNSNCGKISFRFVYCKFGNFREDFIFAKLRFAKIKSSRNGKITLSFISIGKSCLNREFFTSRMCLLMQFAKIKFSRKFPNLQYNIVSSLELLSQLRKLLFQGHHVSVADQGLKLQCLLKVNVDLG